MRSTFILFFISLHGHLTLGKLEHKPILSETSVERVELQTSAGDCDFCPPKSYCVTSNIDKRGYFPHKTDENLFFTCLCKEGYTGNGWHCEDIDECVGIWPCPPKEDGGYCVDTDPTNQRYPQYKCGCIPGFEATSTNKHGATTCTSIEPRVIKPAPLFLNVRGSSRFAVVEEKDIFELSMAQAYRELDSNICRCRELLRVIFEGVSDDFGFLNATDTVTENETIARQQSDQLNSTNSTGSGFYQFEFTLTFTFVFSCFDCPATFFAANDAFRRQLMRGRNTNEFEDYKGVSVVNFGETVAVKLEENGVQSISVDSITVTTTTPSRAPSETPSLVPSVIPSEIPTLSPSDVPSNSPSTSSPSSSPSLSPTLRPTPKPTPKPLAWTQFGDDIDGDGATVSISADGKIVASGSGNNDGIAFISTYNGSWDKSELDSSTTQGEISSISLSANGMISAVVAGSKLYLHTSLEPDATSWNTNPYEFTSTESGCGSNEGIVSVSLISPDGTKSGTILAFRTKEHVCVYKYDATTSWLQMGSIDAGQDHAFLTRSLSLTGNSDTSSVKVAFGEPKISQKGQVSVYQYSSSSSSWDQIGDDLVGGATRDSFGHSVTLSSDGTKLAVGAPYNGDNEEGHVRVYQYSGSSWFQMGSDLVSEAAGDAFGYSVALSSDGTKLAVGAPKNGHDEKGHVRVYQYSGSSWFQMGGDIDGEAANDEFGSSVALSSDGRTVASGAVSPEPSGTDNPGSDSSGSDTDIPQGLVLKPAFGDRKLRRELHVNTEDDAAAIAPAPTGNVRVFSYI